MFLVTTCGLEPPAGSALDDRLFRWVSGVRTLSVDVTPPGPCTPAGSPLYRPARPPPPAHCLKRTDARHGHQPHIPRTILTRQHHRLSHCRMRHQRRFDLAEAPPGCRSSLHDDRCGFQVLEIALRVPAASRSPVRYIRAPLRALNGSATKRSGGESPLDRDSTRAASDSADVRHFLPRKTPPRYRLTLLIQHVDLCIPDGSADRFDGPRRLILGDIPGAGENRCFGRAV